mgnify:CR=1 FL=1
MKHERREKREIRNCVEISNRVHQERERERERKEGISHVRRSAQEKGTD